MERAVKQLKVRIKDIKKVKEGIFLLSFSSPHLAKEAKPGTFVHVKIEPAILRRPLSIHNIKGDTAYLLFKVRGRGTNMLSKRKKNDCLDIIGPLGKGFKLDPKAVKKDPQILIAGGIGVAPLMYLAQKIKKGSGNNLVLLGARTKNELLCEAEFKKLGFKVAVATDDGSKGHKGTVTDLLKETLPLPLYQPPTSIYSCGPEDMFKKMHGILKNHPEIDCQVSFEQFMGCGLGVCCACVIETKEGYKKVCKDGPAFNLKDIW